MSTIIVIQWRLCQSGWCFFSTVFYVIPIPKIGITGGVDFSDLAMSFRVIGVVFLEFYLWGFTVHIRPFSSVCFSESAILVLRATVCLRFGLCALR